MVRDSNVAVVERNVWWDGEFEIEPYEVGWASEALGFLHVLETEGAAPGIDLRVQISADGIHWGRRRERHSRTDAAGSELCSRFRVRELAARCRNHERPTQVIFSWSLK